jgi:hypothetical protein
MAKKAYKGSKLFGNVGSTDVGAARLDHPKIGTADWLVNKVQMKVNERKGGNRLHLTLTCVGTRSSGANAPGDLCDIAIFQNDAWGANVKRLIHSFCRVPLDEDEGVIDAGGALLKEDGWDTDDMHEIDLRNAAYDRICLRMCGLDKDGEPTGEAGCFDGVSIIRVRTTPPKEHREGSDIVFYQFVGGVDPEEVLAELTPEQVIKCFGSEEAAQKLVG